MSLSVDDSMGIELELSVLLAIAILGQSFFARFESETAGWRKALKWGIVVAVTLLLYRWIGHAALWFPLLASAAGLTFHFYWCKKNGIHPLLAEPRLRYFQLRGWRWPEA